MENKLRNWLAFLFLATVTSTHCLANTFQDYPIAAKPQIYKPSFDCNQARTRTERAICRSKELADEDIALSKLYYELVNQQPVDFALQQKRWLKERDYVCSDSLNIERCLLNKYQNRIIQLKQLQLTAPSKSIEVERLEQTNHPVLSVFKRHNIALDKVTYSKDGTCPTFYVTFKIYPLSTENDEYSKKAYQEILKANSLFPYAIVDKEHNYKVNVGFKDKAKTMTIVQSSDVNAPSTCMDGSSNAEAEHYTVIAQMKKQILTSPFKASLRQKDGNKVTAYLYAQDEKILPYEYTGCTTGIKLRVKAKTGHYYIYLYDELTDYFYPNRIPVSNRDKPVIMGIEGAGFFTGPAKGHRPEILVLSQRDTCEDNFYDVYTLWQDQTSLQKLISSHFYSELGLRLRDNKKTA